MKDKLQMLAYNIGAVLIGLVISGCMLLFMKVDPLAVCAEALGKIFSDRYTLGEILVKASPLIFTSLLQGKSVQHRCAGPVLRRLDRRHYGFSRNRGARANARRPAVLLCLRVCRRRSHWRANRSGKGQIRRK